ncbi:hypothetical protein [Stigmatella erecta]|uniref:Myxococcales GC_trans_RRR domain-containing protein n=1 Tax=Stigmatella erecta TaxID=83460 RepID=A0A1I0KU89_9BACT|nr:hypothetical protein [Stigmatella erecta]SEU28846.1 hypothetical protein SAMN05443639_11421 [Stigmatella erecta]
MYGRKWLTRTRFLQGLGVLAGLLGRAPGAQAAPPTIVITEPDLFVPERTDTARTFPFTVQDEGDVEVHAEVSSEMGAPALVAATHPGGAPGDWRLHLTSGAVCQDTTYTVTLVATDKESNITRRQLQATVLHTQRPAKPALELDTSTIRVLPDPAQRVNIAVRETGTPACPLKDYTWTAVTDKAPLLVKNGVRGALFQYVAPQPDPCTGWGTSYLYTVSVKDDAGLESDKTPFLVQVLPWGKPLPAFPSGEKHFTFQPLQTGTVAPDQRRECLMESVTTHWSILEGTLPRRGLQVLDEKNQPVTQWPATAGQLKFRAAACVGTQVRLSAMNRAVDGSGLDGESSTCTVTIDPQWTPLVTGRLGLEEPSATPSSVEGGATVTRLNCLEERGGVEAKLRLTRVSDEALVEEQTFQIPGPWRFGLADNCEGGLYRVTGTLSKNVNEWGAGGVLGPGEEEATAAEPRLVQVPPLEVHLGPLGESQLVASCGQGAQGILRQPLPEGPCAQAEVLWSQASGPALSQPVLRGQEVSASIQEGEFGALIGSEVELNVRADTPGGQTRRQKVTIAAAPFVEVHRVSESRSGSETSLFGVAVALRNTTACGVSEVKHEERLEGLDYVEGSARLDGAPVEAVWEEGTLTVNGLALEGGATRTLTYVVRPHLLGQMAFSGGSSLRDIPISLEPEEDAEASGFGCEGTGPGIAALGLAAGVLVLRRRRREG